MIDKDLALDYIKTFGTESGKRVLQDLLTRFYGMSPMVSPEEPTADPTRLAIRTGNHAVAMHIVGMVNLDAIGYLDAVTQAMKRRKK